MLPVRARRHRGRRNQRPKIRAKRPAALVRGALAGHLRLVHGVPALDVLLHRVVARDDLDLGLLVGDLVHLDLAVLGRVGPDPGLAGGLDDRLGVLDLVGRDELGGRLHGGGPVAQRFPQRAGDHMYAEMRPVVHGAQRLEVARRLDPLLEVVVAVEVQAELLVDLLQVDPAGLRELDVRVVQLDAAAAVVVADRAAPQALALHAGLDLLEQVVVRIFLARLVGRHVGDQVQGEPLVVRLRHGVAFHRRVTARANDTP
ncbi:hypothetical protein AB0M46_29150 [Dactylosporangium sp. NPDC051485]|uniref:hypothetical protein n=1 Tax=Dactylosporangium sp. NPDC051485 TaxID=3154846 RepID=UPI0034222B84